MEFYIKARGGRRHKVTSNELDTIFIYKYPGNCINFLYNDRRERLLCFDTYEDFITACSKTGAAKKKLNPALRSSKTKNAILVKFIKGA